MKRVWKGLKSLLRSYRSHFFLRKHIPNEATLRLLKILYPDVNWNRVDFYEGLPWFTPFVAPYVTAQALPQFYSFSRYRIYVTKFDESRAQCVADIIHEGFHVNQAMQYWKGYGLGFFRGLMVHYNAYFVTHGYRQNPFEIPAYDQEFRFLDVCEKHGIHGISPRMSDQDLKDLAMDKALVYKEAQLKYHGNVFAFAGSVLVCTAITLVKPVADLLLFVTGELTTLTRKKEA